MTSKVNIIKRIELLESFNEIKKLKFKYWNACDSKKPNEILECFCSNKVHIDFEDFGIFSCAQDMVNKFKLNSCNQHLLEQHSGKNPVINLLSNNEANGFWSISYSLIDTKKNLCLNINGTYEDIYIRQKPGNWLIKKTVFIKTSSMCRSLSSGYCSKPRIERSLGFKKTV